MKIFYHSLPLFKEEPTAPAVVADPTVDNAPAEDPPEVPWTSKEHPIFEPKTNMYMISGDNPNYHFNGRPLTEKEKEKGVFRTSNAALVRNLQSRKDRGDERLKNMTLEVGRGRYTGKDESSVLVTNAPIDIIEDVARQHGQESFVHLPPYPAAIRMVYANGPHRGEHEHGVRENTQTFMEPPADYFTKLPSLGGKYLRFGFNWNNFHKNDENDCPSDTGVFKPKPPKDEQQTQATPQEEPAMKNEKTVEDLKKALAEKLNGLIKEHENFLVGLRKGDMEKKSPPGHEKQVEHIAESYEDKGKSSGQAKAIATATAWKQHGEHGEHSKEASAPAKKGECCKKCGKAECMGKCDMSDVKKGEPCKKCGGMMKAGYGCAKCDMSDVKPEKSMSKSAVEEVASFLSISDKLVKAAKESSASAEDSAPLSLADKKMGGKGPKEIPESSEVSAPGSGDDAKAGKPEKAPSLGKSVYDIKSEESSKSKEESSSKEKSKEESSSVSKSLDLVTDLIKAFDHKSPMPHAAHAAPSAGLPAHAPVAKQPVLHTHPAGAAIPQGVSHAHPMQGKLDALKARAANMKKPMIPSVK